MTTHTHTQNTPACVAIFKRVTALFLTAALSVGIVGCGGGDSETGSPATAGIRTFNATQAAGITPAVAASLSDAEVVALGGNIHYLSNAALTAFTQYISSARTRGQIQSITPAQIDALSPVQVHYLGLESHSAGYSTARIAHLNNDAWATLVNNRLQMAAITAYEMPLLPDTKIVAMGTNVGYLTDSALSAMEYHTGGNNLVGQIQSLLASQVAVLTPAQIRLLGALGSGGVNSVSQFARLGNGAWATLVSEPAQVAAFTAEEMPTIGDDRLTAIGTNIRYLSDAALAAISPYVSSSHLHGQIQSISAAQIAALSPAQVRMLGALTSGGTIGTSDIALLNDGAWATLVSNRLQVGAITTAEAPLLPDARITSLGANIQYLSDAALGALSPIVSSGHLTGQIQSISGPQITVLSPAQMAALATTYRGLGVAYFSVDAFGSLSAAQVNVWTPANVVNITAAKLAVMTPAALAGLAPATAASFTAQQKVYLTTPQHTACGC